MIKNINWYPGHMKKTRELIHDNLRAVDLVVEIVDSRIPLSSRNPVIDNLIGEKKRIMVLGKSDLADPKETEKWIHFFENQGNTVIAMNIQSGEHIKRFFRILDSYQKERNETRSLKRPLRLMIVGVPNVGKSSFINRLIGKKSVKTGNKPGVTKGKQWVTLQNGMQLLDTPGILWPKFEDQKVGLYLAFCGNIKDEILNIQDLAYELLKVLRERYPNMIKLRYGIDIALENPEEFNEYGEPVNPIITDMENIAHRRGFLLPGKKVDYERTGRMLLDEFRDGKLGRLTLEYAEDLEKR